MTFPVAIACVILIGIAWQDFRFRAVYWWLFPLLLLVLGAWQFFSPNRLLLTEKLLYNCCFIFFQLLCVCAYLSWKERRPVNIFKGYFGLGDLLLLISITVYFSFLNYALFYLFSLLMVIVFTLTGNVLRKRQDLKIPLAGYQAILVLLCMLVDQFFLRVNFGSDVWLVNYLAR